MTLDRLGSHWLHPDRNLHGKPYFSVELLYARDATPGYDWHDMEDRVAMVRSKGAALALRLDWRPRQVLPGMDDDVGAHDYCTAVQTAVAEFDPDYLICGNEPNLHSETGGNEIQPWWVARMVYGHWLAPSSTDCAYQYARTANPRVEVLCPPVAPYSPDSAGDTTGCTPPDGRHSLAPWESYQYDLARSCYDHGGHVPDLGGIVFAAHTYGRTGTDGTANGGAMEPWQDVRIQAYTARYPTYRGISPAGMPVEAALGGPRGAQFGSRWLQDMLYLCRQGMQASPYAVDLYPAGVLITEANTYTDAWPSESYPAGWWQQLARYVGQFPNIWGLAGFVDQDYGGGWGQCAMTVPNGKLPAWDKDHDALLAGGW